MATLQAKRVADAWPKGVRWRSPRPLMIQLAVLWLGVMFFVALFADQLAPYEVDQQFLRQRLSPPGTPGFWLGTDKLGRDILSRLCYSIQISMAVATMATLLGCVLGATVGLIAAHFDGVIDDVIMLLVDFQAALPPLIFALAVLAFIGNSFVIFILVLGILGWETYARLTRGMTLAAKAQAYVTAVNALGVRPWRIYLRHILPNIAHALIVALTLNFPGVILAEASLSFLGLGVQPPLSSLGLMLSIGRDYLTTAWWAAIFPGAVIFLTTLAVSLFGDWLRDYLDPTIRQ